MRTRTVTYKRVPVVARRRVTCPVCGEKRTAQRTFAETINPYHSAVQALDNPTMAEAYAAVHKSVEKKATTWVPSAMDSMHARCVPDDE